MSNAQINWIDAYENGYLRDGRAFTLYNNIPPNKYTYTFEDNTVLNLDKVDINALKTRFPEAIITKSTIIDNSSTSCVNEEEWADITEFELPISTQPNSITTAFINIYNGSVFYLINSKDIVIYYIDEDPEILLNEIVNFLPKKPIIPRESEVQLIVFNQEYYTITSKIKPTNIDIHKNYNDDFIPAFNDLKNFVNDRKSGLAVLRGTKGSGKTTVIRHLITTCPNKYIIVTNAIAENLASPEFISFMLDNKDSIFVLEDCEQVLMKRGTNYNSFGGAITNILNMSDGLMSDIFNVKFICTFNADIEAIDDALLRKGRCFVNYEFKELCADKTKVLLNERGITLDKYVPMTLADIYNYESTSCEAQTVKKIGF